MVGTMVHSVSLNWETRALRGVSDCHLNPFSNEHLIKVAARCEEESPGNRQAFRSLSLCVFTTVFLSKFLAIAGLALWHGRQSDEKILSDLASIGLLPIARYDHAVCVATPCAHQAYRCLPHSQGYQTLQTANGGIQMLSPPDRLLGTR